MKAELIDPEDLAYAAGFIEADGCFHLTNSSIGIRVTNKNLDVLNWFKGKFGGELSSKVTPSNCWDWNIYGEAANDLAHALSPYLKFKDGQRRIITEFFITIGPRGKKTEQWILDYRTELRQKMKDLKHAS